MGPKFDVVTATAAELQTLLDQGKIDVVEIVQTYIDQIEQHNLNGLKLRSIISVAPTQNVITRARALDEERLNGRSRGPLHGVPVVLKDAIMTDYSLGMDTTVGAHVFAGTKPLKSAALVEQLQEAGAIILGKASLTEFCGHKAYMNAPGWSSYFGQTLSAFQKKGLDPKEQPTPGGSSAGSGVSVAAGFAPLAIGTETGGSNVYPASCSGLYSIRMTRGFVPRDGVFRISNSFDGIGAMGKTAQDVADLMTAIATPSIRDILPKSGYREYLTNDWRGINVGVLPPDWGHADPKKWLSEAVKIKYESVPEHINRLGGKAIYPAELPLSDIFQYEGKDIGMPLAYHEFKSEFEKFTAQYQNPRVHNLKELIDWNEEHKDIAMPEPFPDQKPLLESLNETMTEEYAAKSFAYGYELACNTLNTYMTEKNIDILVSNSDASLVSWGSMTGWPIATVPLGNLASNDQPYGIFFLAREGREDHLLKFMSAFEASFPKIKKPSQLV